MVRWPDTSSPSVFFLPAGLKRSARTNQSPGDLECAHLESWGTEPETWYQSREGAGKKCPYSSPSKHPSLLVPSTNQIKRGQLAGKPVRASLQGQSSRTHKRADKGIDEGWGLGKTGREESDTPIHPNRKAC